MIDSLCGTVNDASGLLGVARDGQRIERGWAVRSRRCLGVYDNCTPLWKQPLMDACAIWNDAQEWVCFIPQPGTPDRRERIAGAIVIRTTQTPFAYNGITENLYTTGNNIASSVITLDESNYINQETGVDMYPYPLRQERMWLMLHELGHTLGLPHPTGEWATQKGRGIMGHEHNPDDMIGVWARHLLTTYYESVPAPRRKRRRRRR